MWKRFLSSVAVLRDYQEECIRTSIEHFITQGIKRQAVSLPVGAGKTVILSNLISRFPSPNSNANKVLVLAHREELLLQACIQIRKFNPKKIIELEKGEFMADTARADVIVASVPTLGRRDETSGICERLKRFNPEEFKCIIIDEAHHSAAPSYRRILDHFNALDPLSHLLVWGCSATLRRNDHLALGDLFEKVVYHVDMNRMIQNGWLCRPELLQVFTEFNLENVALDSSGEDFSLDDLSLTLNTPKRNHLIAETWHSQAREKGSRKSTLVFAINVAHVYGLAKAFEAVSGISPKIITGKTESSERAQILSEFSSGLLPLIINCGVLTEGTDLPRTDCILLARPTCNASLYIQMIGRGLRTHPDKTDCLVLDVIDKMKSPKRSLITFPTLLALQEASKSNRDPSVDQSEIKKRKDRRIGEINFEVVTVKINKSKITAINLENERLAWVNIPAYPIHVLECPEFRIVLMEEESNFQNCLYTAVVTSRKLEEEEGFNGFERSASHSYKLTIGTSLGIREILNEIDNYISDFERKTHKSLTQNLSRTAFWRRSYPPSTKQQSILFKAAKKYYANDVDIRAIFKVSKGQAANAISRINFLKPAGDRHIAIIQCMSEVSSPKSIDSGSSNSKFKTLKKKIRNKFRLSRPEEVKTLAQAVETLKRSDEFLTSSPQDSDQMKAEFKELKETLESIISQNQTLSEVVKSVDSSCPDPFNDAEKFSVYFAQKSLLSGSSLSDDESDLPLNSQSDNVSTGTDDTLLKLQNLRMEERRGFQMERENYESRLSQISLLQQEIDHLRKENSEHEIQLDFLKTQTANNTSESASDEKEIISKYELEISTLNQTIESLKNSVSILEEADKKNAAQIEAQNALIQELESKNVSDHDHLEQECLRLKSELDAALLQVKSLQESSTLSKSDEVAHNNSDILEENSKLKAEIEELQQRLFETQKQLSDIEKEPVSSIIPIDSSEKSFDESAFKYVYLSNLVLKFMQFPEQRSELSHIILTTLQSDQPHFKKAMAGQK